MKQKRKSIFKDVGGLVTKITIISVFCLKPVALYFKGMPNSVGFCKRIFLHVIPAPVIPVQ